MKKPAYEELLELSKKIHSYEAALTLLHWDQETYMPPGAIGPRSRQVSEIAELIHREKAGKKFKSLLSKLKKSRLDKEKKINVREWGLEYERATKLPADFVKAFSQLTSESVQVWAAAKKENNFKLFAPFLEKIISMNRKKADIVGFSDHPYDALIENYEPCMTSRKLDTIFGSLQKELKNLLKKISDAKKPPSEFLEKNVDENLQFAIGKILLAKLPLDPKCIRLDVSSHPFSLALHPYDSRITTRLIPNAFMSNILSVLHEAGHALYEMGLPAEHWGSPLGEYVSLSIHESQSRLWETIIGRSLPFWKFFYPILQKELSFLKNTSLDHFYRGIHQVKPSFIRVEADEVTYCLHVILRFEIEKMLISGKLAVSDLPDAWNGKMKEFFGLTPKTDTEGCLQDIHWSLGDFGYFPTYALGNLFAAQFFSAFHKHHPNWEKEVEKGEFTALKDWLRKNIHSLGKTYTSEELAKHATGKNIDASAYCSYLKKKYGEIYQLT